MSAFRRSYVFLIAVALLSWNSDLALGQENNPQPSEASSTPQEIFPGNSTSANQSDLTPSSTYATDLGNTQTNQYISEQALGNSPAASTSAATNQMLPAPQGLEARTGGDRILLAWEPLVSADQRPVSYQLYRLEAPFPETIDPAQLPLPINLQPIAEEYFLDSATTSRNPPLPRGHYFYLLMAVDAQGNSSNFSSVLEVINISELCQPMGVETMGRNHAVLLSWMPVFSGGESGLAGYKIYRSLQADERGESLFDQALPEVTYEDKGSTPEGLENGKKYFYTVLAQDNAGNLSTPSEQVMGIPYLPATAPQALTATGKTDEMIELSWKEAQGGTFLVRGYNVYRMTAEMEVPEKINQALVTDTWYMDSAQNSTTPPILGRTYTYTVRAVDEEGFEGEVSAAMSATPMVPLEIPKRGLLSTSIPGLPPESSLTISGRKKIDIGYTEVMPLNIENKVTERYPSITSGLTKGFELKQELQVKLQGKVGKKITVDVDYDDTLEEQRKISIIYTGDPDEVVQEAAFGDITLDLPSTEFAGYNKTLFGAKLKIGLERFRFMAIGAQTKGITVTEKFKGNTSQKTISIQDVNFEPFKYYFLTKDWPAQVNYPDLPGYTSSQKYHGVIPGSVQIYVTDSRITADTVRVDRLIGGNTQTASFNFKAPGIDYTVDYERGIVTFTQAIERNWLIAVAYRYRDANDIEHTIGYNPDGSFDFTPSRLQVPTDSRTSNNAHLIQDYNSATNERQYHMMLMNRYSLGYQNIFDPKSDPDFEIKVYTASGSSEIHIEQPNEQAVENIYKIDPNFGTIEFRHLYPFQEGSMSDKTTRYLSDTYDPDRNDAYNPNLNVYLGGGNNSLANKYKIEVQFKNLITNFTLSHWNIIKNSEVIKKDGQKLLRNSDYYIDYDTGFITFLQPENITRSSEITITYEYMPFGGKYQTNIFGARAEYDLIPKRLSLGSTYLYQASQAPLDIPDVRSTPSSLSLIDGDIKLALNPDDFSQLAEPFMGKTTIPVTTEVSAEVAYSHYEINTFRYSGEQGVAILDSMDGSDNVLSLPPDNNSWFPASAPEGIYATPGNRNYIRQTVVYELGRLPINSNDKKHQLRWNFTNLNDTRWDGFIYPVSTSGMNMRDYRFIELAVYSTVASPQRVILNFDLGVLSEDSNGNGRMNFEGDGTNLGKDADHGIENYISGYDNNNQPIISSDPSGPQGIYPPGASVGYWGDGNNRLNSEDLDQNHQLDTTRSYYRYVTPLVQGWNYIKIPLTQFTAALGDHLPETNVQSQQFLSFVKHVRMWMTVENPMNTNGYVQFETICLTGNKWQARVSPGTTDTSGDPITEPNPLKINLGTISLETDPSYVPNTNFFIYDEDNKEEEIRNEQALRLTYNLNQNDVNTSTAENTPAYYFTRSLDNQGYDYSGYRYLSLDVLKKTETLPGEYIFVRLALDENNYYEYKFPLDSNPNAKKGSGDYWIVGAWHTLNVELDGSDNNRTICFQPNVIQGLHQIKEVSIGVFNPNAIGRNEILWLNNLRVSGGKARFGVAYRVTSNTMISDILTIKTDHREVDADFITIDENPGGKQHTLREEVSTKITQFNFLPMAATWNRTETFTEQEHRDIPAYSNNFTKPDNIKESANGSLGFNGQNELSGLDLNLNLSQTSTWNNYIRQLTNPNRFERLSTAEPSVSYALPDRILDWPIGSSTLSGRLNYTDSWMEVDEMALYRLGRTEKGKRFKHTYDETYTYKGSYSPFQYLRLDPMFTYGQSNNRGFLSPYTFYAELDPGKHPENPYSYSDIYRMSQISRVAGLSLYLADIPMISPSVTYEMRNTRDYINDTLNVPGRLGWQSSIDLNRLGGWQWIPQFYLSQDYDVSATYRVMAGNDPIQDLDFKTLWLIIPTEFTEVNPLFDTAYINSRSRTDSLRTNFNLISEVSLSPRYSFTWKRSMNTPGNFRTTHTTSLGSNLIWNKLSLVDWLTLYSLNLNYDYYETRDFDTNQEETTNNVTHNTTLSLPFELTTDWRGDISLGSKNTLRRSGVELKTKDFENEYTAGLAFTYNLRMVDPIRLPNFWPFSGALIKIEQALLLQNAFRIVLVRNYEEQNKSRDVFTDMFTNETTVKYSLWKNVDGNVRLLNQWYYDKRQDNRDYWAISLKAGLTAVF